MNALFSREDVEFYSGSTRCAAWLYLPNGTDKFPIIVLAHGLGGTRQLRLDKIAEKFASAGFACLLFDYRNYGASDGNRRQLINVKMQLEDWHNAIDFIKYDHRIDAERILLFGTSFSGGHVISLSAQRSDIRATIAQCPYVDTLATIKAVSFGYVLKKAPFVIADVLTSLFGYHPIMLKLTTYSGENAFMEADEVTTKKFIGDADFVNEAPARTLLEFVKYSPGKYFKKIKTPILVAACLRDTLAPADKTIYLAASAKNATINTYDCGHFDIYLSPYFEQATSSYIEFFKQTL